jgi:hypothetical protein
MKKLLIIGLAVCSIIISASAQTGFGSLKGKKTARMNPFLTKFFIVGLLMI